MAGWALASLSLSLTEQAACYPCRQPEHSPTRSMSVYRKDHLLHLGEAGIGVSLSKTLRVGPETLELEAMLRHLNSAAALGPGQSKQAKQTQASTGTAEQHFKHAGKRLCSIAFAKNCSSLSCTRPTPQPRTAGWQPVRVPQLGHHACAQPASAGE